MEGKMNTRQLGKNGPQLTEIGLGTWAIGGPWQFGWGPQDDQESIETIHKAIDLGINWIDTAAVYGLGHSEKIVGQAIKNKHKEVFIATKCGQVWDENRKVRTDDRPEIIRRECEDSLRRLGVDVIDLYQIHWPDPRTSVRDSWGEMVRLKEEGKVRYIGVSNFGVDQLEKCQAIHPVQSIQPPYSMLHRAKYPEVENEILTWCKRNEVGVITYGSLQNGLLTGKFDHKTLEQLDQGDWRRRSEFFKETLFSKALKFVEALKPIAENYGNSVTELAIAWVLMNPAVTSAIIGARKPEQVEKNVGGTGWKISEQDMETIQRLINEITV
jgi:aryl-alcohol dehydrogenase-like predicted oxidoreductase